MPAMPVSVQTAFDKRVEITLHDKTKSCCRSQAEVIPRFFFSFHDVLGRSVLFIKDGKRAAPV